MKLSQLLSVYPQLRWGDDPARDVTSLCQDSRKVEAGSVYVAVRGHAADGHDFLAAAAAQGAIGLIVESDAQIPVGYAGAVVVVDDTRKALNQLASRYYGQPAEQLFCVGVTGTNGKTTITHMIEAVLTRFGWPTGVMGTIDHHLGERRWTSQLTTPDALTLHKRLREFVALGAKAAAFEVSSHALDQQRADYIPFDVVVFSNLTRDHLDYHGTFEKYFAAKERLFREIPLNAGNKPVTAIVNVDDPYGRRLRVADRVRVWSYGGHGAQLNFHVLNQGFDGTRIRLSTPRGEAELLVPLPGLHNVQNAVAAVGAGLAAGASLEVCRGAIENFRGVRGRLERVENDRGLHVFVDYAHTDDALKSVLSALDAVRRATGSGSRFLTVFGCGGDRDRGKRPLMARAAVEGSDFVFVTSDNPRREDPRAIIDDILTGVASEDLNRRVFVDVDRREAIARAVRMARAGDVVLIAGKGHETYQIMGDQYLPFDDVQVAREILR